MRSLCLQAKSCSAVATCRARGKALTARAMPDQAEATFTYFDGRGHGERIRYALASSDISWNEVLLTEPGDMERVRGQCTFGQVPLLQIDGLKLTQSWSIVRYLANRKGGLTPAEAALADTCGEQVRDFYESAGFLMYGWGDVQSGRARISSGCARFFPLFDDFLEKHQRSFLVKDSPCWADFQLLLALDYSVDVLGERALQPYAKLSKLRQALRALPCMQSYYASDKCKGLVDEKYIDSVRRAMS